MNRNKYEDIYIPQIYHIVKKRTFQTISEKSHYFHDDLLQILTNRGKSKLDIAFLTTKIAFLL